MTAADRPEQSAAVRTAARIFMTCSLIADSLAFSIHLVSADAPFTAEDIQKLSMLDKSHLEAFVSRFSKLQDIIGASLFRAILILDLEDVPPAMLDMLAAMEKRGLIDDEDSWRMLRTTRNGLSHTYPDDPATVAENLNKALRQAPELLAILERVRAYLVRRGLTDLPPVPTLDPPVTPPA